MPGSKRFLFLLAFALILVSSVGFDLSPALAKAKLRVCLEDGSPPYSYKFGKRKGGFDLMLAGRIAEMLNMDLQIQWYESEDDDEVVPIYEINTLLSADYCDFLGGFALIASNLAKPIQPTAALPDYDGMKRSERGRRVTMGELTATAPYIRAGLTVILGAKNTGKSVAKLSDLAGLRVGAEVSTLSSALLLRYQGGLLADDSRHFTPGDIFKELEKGTVDAALVERHRFDRHLARNPNTKLTASKYLHSIAYNLSFAVLKGSEAPIQSVNEIINQLIKNGEMAKVAAAAGISFIPPAEPYVLQRISPDMLMRD